MEGSESEAIFDSLNLNPQLFINETLNSVDNAVDDAFFVFQEEASTLLKTDGTDRSDDLAKGIDHIRNLVQGDLDKNLGLWETHCLRNIFAVPEGFSLPEDDELHEESSIDQDGLKNAEMDAQLDSLRIKLSMVAKETAELNRELQSLKRQSALSKRCTQSVNEVLELYEQNSGHNMFQEMIKTASELRKKMEKFKSQRMEETERTITERIYNPNRDMYLLSCNKGFSKAELTNLEEIVADLKKM